MNSPNRSLPTIPMNATFNPSRAAPHANIAEELPMVNSAWSINFSTWPNSGRTSPDRIRSGLSSPTTATSKREVFIRDYLLLLSLIANLIQRNYDYLFRPDKDIPSMNCFCAMKKTMINGNILIKPPAISTVYFPPCVTCCWKNANPTVSVVFGMAGK